MSFLNASMLWGLIAISIPILIHIFNLRKVKKVEFSTLMFLKELQKSKLKRIKLKQLLLLISRICIIVFLVLAFAKPVILNVNSTGTSSVSNVFIVLDNSYSMSVRNQNGTYLDQSKKIVQDIIKKYKDTDNIYIIPSSDLLLKSKNFLVPDLNSVKDKTDSIKISYIKNNAGEFLNFINNVIQTNKGVEKNEVYIISDFQTVNLNENNSVSNYNFNNASLNLIKFSDRIVNNISIEDFEFNNSFINIDGEIKLKFKISNNSKYDVINKNVILSLDDKKISEKYIDLKPESKSDVEMSFRTDRPGNYKGKLELIQDDLLSDEIKEDNFIYFNLFIPDTYNILINENEPGSSVYIELLLNSLKLSDLSGNSQNLKFNIIKSDLSNADFSSYNLIILTGLNSIDENKSNKLYDYVIGGGGLLIFPGNSPDLTNLNKNFLSKFNELLINRELAGYEGLKINYLNSKHPVIESIFRNENNNIDEELNIKSYYEILKSKNSFSLISLNNNTEFLVESKNGEGSLILSSVPADLNKSDFPINKIFAPVIYRSILYLSNKIDINKYFEVGKNNIVKLRLNPGELNFVSPGGESKTLKTESDIINIGYDKFTQYTGNYILEDSLKNIQYISLNKNPVESNLLYANNEDIENYFSKYNFGNLEIINAGENYNFAAVNQSKGFELWWIFLLLSGVFILIEYFLSRNIEN
ncbi:MAG: BatA domain-containing protein [Ignavibacteria bacterium]|nr:BatA domain-containing protein [Ignavibacteria bacterium]